MRARYGSRLAVIYKTFPLAVSPDDLVRRFGSRERAKAEILTHWARAARESGGERINPALMATRDFAYPSSMPGLTALKAAEAQGGAGAHARLFELIQEAHLVHCRDIADRAVLLDCAAAAGLDLDRFVRGWEGEETVAAVLQDQAEASWRGIHSTPTVIVGDSALLVGAVSQSQYEEVIGNLLEDLKNAKNCLGKD